MEHLILAFTILLSSIQPTLAAVDQQINEPMINVFSLDYEYGPYSSEYGNGNGYGQNSSSLSVEDDKLLDEVD